MFPPSGSADLSLGNSTRRVHPHHKINNFNKLERIFLDQEKEGINWQTMCRTTRKVLKHLCTASQSQFLHVVFDQVECTLNVSCWQICSLKKPTFTKNNMVKQINSNDCTCSLKLYSCIKKVKVWWENNVPYLSNHNLCGVHHMTCPCSSGSLRLLYFVQVGGKLSILHFIL